MNSRARASDHTRKAVKSVATDRATERKRAEPPVAEPFQVAVDRQLKSGHPTYESAEKAALIIKRQYPQLHVTVYDSRQKRHTDIERPASGGRQ